MNTEILAIKTIKKMRFMFVSTLKKKNYETKFKIQQRGKQMVY